VLKERPVCPIYWRWQSLNFSLYLPGELYFLALEAETAINHLHISKQDHVRHLVANKLKHLIKYDTNKENRNNKHRNEWNIIKNIKQKLENNNLTLTQADKGKTIVILQKQTYEQYIQEFLNRNNFTLLTQDPTQNFHRKIQTVIQ
jgi:predicted  nucleic acid-binding Zn-ribbon protein